MGMNIKQITDFDDIVPWGVARMLCGSSGIGKSSVIHQIAAKKGRRVVEVHLSEKEPGDICGLPYLDKLPSGQSVTRYAAPEWWNELDENTDLFLDEVDRAREDMQPIAMQLILARTAGGRKLPDGCRVWAACNGEKYMVIPQDQANINRYAKINFEPDVAEWLEWANTADSGVHPALVQYITENKKSLDTPEAKIGVENMQVPTRRSWTTFGRVLSHPRIADKLRDVGPQLISYAEPFVGFEAALHFEQWIKENYMPLTTEDIFSGKAKPNTFPMAQMISTIDLVIPIFHDEKTTDEQRINALLFYSRSGAEVFMAVFERIEHTHAMMIANHEELGEFVNRIADEMEVFEAQMDKEREEKKKAKEEAEAKAEATAGDDIVEDVLIDDEEEEDDDPES